MTGWVYEMNLACAGAVNEGILSQIGFTFLTNNHGLSGTVANGYQTSA
jgi:hypothetical protein